MMFFFALFTGSLYFILNIKSTLGQPVSLGGIKLPDIPNAIHYPIYIPLNSQSSYYGDNKDPLATASSWVAMASEMYPETNQNPFYPEVYDEQQLQEILRRRRAMIHQRQQLQDHMLHSHSRAHHGSMNSIASSILNHNEPSVDDLPIPPSQHHHPSYKPDYAQSSHSPQHHHPPQQPPSTRRAVIVHNKRYQRESTRRSSPATTSTTTEPKSDIRHHPYFSRLYRDDDKQYN